MITGTVLTLQYNKRFNSKQLLQSLLTVGNSKILKEVHINQSSSPLAELILSDRVSRWRGTRWYKTYRVFRQWETRIKEVNNNLSSFPLSENSIETSSFWVIEFCAGGELEVILSIEFPASGKLDEFSLVNFDRVLRSGELEDRGTRSGELEAENSKITSLAFHLLFTWCGIVNKTVSLTVVK